MAPPLMVQHSGRSPVKAHTLWYHATPLWANVTDVLLWTLAAQVEVDTITSKLPLPTPHSLSLYCISFAWALGIILSLTCGPHFGEISEAPRSSAGRVLHSNSEFLPVRHVLCPWLHHVAQGFYEEAFSRSLFF